MGPHPWELLHALFPGTEGTTQEVSCFPSEIQAMPGKEGEPPGAEESRDLIQEGFLEEEAP